LINRIIHQTIGLYYHSEQRLQKGNRYLKRGTGVVNKKISSDFFGFYYAIPCTRKRWLR